MTTASLTKQLFVLLLLLSITTLCSSQKRLIQNAHVGVLYPVSTNGTQADEYTNHFSLHIFSGLSRNERGFAFSGLSTIIRDSLTGFQVSGIYNHSGKSAKGAQIAGIANTSGSNSGFQVAGITNVVKGNSEGFQVGGLVNIVKDSSKGLQVAGIRNLASNANVQIGGLVNKATNVNVQIGGLVNKAKKVKGIQIGGFLNIADSSDYTIGLINLVKNGEKSIGVTTDENQTTLLALRSGGRIMYGIVGIGYNLSSKKDLYALEIGIGAHLKVSDKFRFNTEAAVSTLTDFHRGEYFKTSYRMLAAWKPAKALELFAGPSFNFIEHSEDKDLGISDHYIWKRTRHDWFKGFTIGGMAGVQVNF